MNDLAATVALPRQSLIEETGLKQTRVGLLGAGYIMKAHAKALQAVDNVVLHAVCDVAIGRAQAAASELDIPNVFASLDALAASDCDAVHVLLPPSLHVGAARQLLEAGKSVFIEKPMGTSAEDCRLLDSIAKRHGLRLGVNHNFLFMPAYQPIRDAVHSQAIGAIDQLSLNWLYALPLLQFGPFNAWMVAQPGNLVLELGSHLAAFALDLLGSVEVITAHAGNAIELPGQQRVYRHWTAIGRAGRASLVMNISVAPGQADRSMSLRALGGVAHLDFDKGIAWQEAQSSDNPIFDNVLRARRTAKAISAGASRDFGRYLYRTLRKAHAANPFEDSIYRSIAAFYDSNGTVDPRLSASFGAQVVELCEGIAAHAGVMQESDPRPLPAVQTKVAPNVKPTVLVVGGTGFIGKRLVERLVGNGFGVRVLTRSSTSARIELAGLDVDVMQGSHSDPELLDRALNGITTVYHLAKAEGRRWEDYVQNDIEPTRKLANAALRHGVARFIYTGTIDSYASSRAKDRITGETPVDPAIAKRNLYARSKAACEALLKDLALNKSLPLITFRPGVVIGEGSPPAHMGVGNFISGTHAQFWGDGRNKVPFVLVDDVADALARAVDAPDIVGRTLLLTDEPLLSAREYVAAVQERCGAHISAEPRSIWRYWFIDYAKEAAKHIVRHPNRRASTFHDWNCRAHRSTYDARETRELLGWRPAGTREALIDAGINASVDRFMR